MRIAIIDLGTNSVRFDVHQLGPGKRVRQLHREKIMVRLGQGVFLHGKLDRNAVQRTLHAFRRFKKVSEQFKVGKIVAFGTSALREVSDRDRFLKKLHEATDIHVRVISGAEEAQLIALGILSQEKVGKERFAMVDIGGGSTEITVCRGKEILHSMSFPLGTARLQQLYLKKSPPNPESVQALRQFIRGTLSGTILTEGWLRGGKPKRIIGSSGTIRALAKVLSDGSGKDGIERGPLGDLVDEMAKMTTTDLLGISGIESKRIDMIVAGGILFHEIMEVLEVKKASVTELSLRDGILAEEEKLFVEGDVSHLALHLPDLMEKAVQFGGHRAHLERVSEMAGELFDRLRPLHKLDPSWKIYLKAAMILRDTGEAINLADHEAHSAYIVENAEFPATEVWESEFIARLCLLHEGAKLAATDVAFLKQKARKDAFPKLLALLRLADALDSGPDTNLKVRKIRISKKSVQIDYSGRGLTGLETVQVEKRAPFFEKVFKRELKTQER